jgi:hypothetical protein
MIKETKDLGKIIMIREAGDEGYLGLVGGGGGGSGGDLGTQAGTSRSRNLDYKEGNPFPGEKEEEGS